MLDFSGKDGKAKDVAFHYARVLDRPLIESIIRDNGNVKNKDDAISLAQFYWEMLDRSAFDSEQGIEVLGEADLQFWMERLLNIIGGYLSTIGYEDEWNEVCDDA